MSIIVKEVTIVIHCNSRDKRRVERLLSQLKDILLYEIETVPEEQYYPEVEVSVHTLKEWST